MPESTTGLHLNQNSLFLHRLFPQVYFSNSFPGAQEKMKKKIPGLKLRDEKDAKEKCIGCERWAIYKTEGANPSHPCCGSSSCQQLAKEVNRSVKPHKGRVRA